MRAATWTAIVWFGMAATASANTSRHSGSSGGSSSSGECIRWEPILGDMAGADMPGADMAQVAASDGGVPLDMSVTPPDLGDPHAGMRCVEYAGLFNCSFAPPGRDAGGGAVVFAFALLLAARTRRSRVR